MATDIHPAHAHTHAHAHGLDPDLPQAWDARIADAAYARYVRGAVDFAGGRRLEKKP